ncbi:GNAT family N-acetyltransferase [Paeniglutamicibacter sp. MACA_103]|uniref:GNAT family N-acetyltransferase n=1 Tax=Paeniglutamicibacter sp. MACA_103 TaxID=3377337 RepID=UPI00389439F7
MEISTKRLVLREFSLDDLDAVHAFAADPQVCAFLEWGPNTPEDTAGFLRQCEAEQGVRPRETHTLAVTRDSTPIGSIALMRAESDLVREPGEAEIGYVLRADAWGNGYAAEAATAMLELAWHGLGISRVLATCRPENLASVRVLEKVGMRCVDYLHGHKLIDGVARDSLLFAMRSPRLSRHV